MSESSGIMQLTGKQNRFLRGLGHGLQPYVMIGKNHLSGDVINATKEALETHELIKVRIQEGCLTDRKIVLTLVGSGPAAGMEDWMAPSFDAAKAGWKKGLPPFGQLGGKLEPLRNAGSRHLATGAIGEQRLIGGVWEMLDPAAQLLRGCRLDRFGSSGQERSTRVRALRLPGWRSRARPT